MSNKSVYHRLTWPMNYLKHSATVASDFYLTNHQMKQLNDKKQFKEALELFDEYKKTNPEAPSDFIFNQALKACTQIGDLQRVQCGDVTQAQLLFDTSSKKTAAMYGAMMKGFITNHQRTKAIDLFNEIKKPDEVIIILLCNSCAQLGTNEALEFVAYDRMEKHFPKLSDLLTPSSILCANVYASSTEFEKRLRAHDQSHPRSSEIYAEVEKISKELIEHGHQYDASRFTRPLDYDETVASVLCGHSEKLAIALNFVENANTRRIQLTKNVRVCGDCHRATKLIAAIRRCEIIVRDANRIHHFHPNGQCSCNDYF